MVGEVPEWYPTIRAARYLGVAPWELAERDDAPFWESTALSAERAEARVRDAEAKRRQ